VHSIRKQRLYVVAFIVVFSSAAVALMLFALSSNINLFYPPRDIAAGKAPTGQSIRAGGMVVEESVLRSADGLTVRFQITDYKATVDVVYSGILPDLFAEGQGAVASGKLDEQGVFQASEVLAKHDENYMPPEVADALAEQHETSLYK
jgi:cytochrome c-type biogenesis protein CcmE